MRNDTKRSVSFWSCEERSSSSSSSTSSSALLLARLACLPEVSTLVSLRYTAGILSPVLTLLGVTPTQKTIRQLNRPLETLTPSARSLQFPAAVPSCRIWQRNNVAILTIVLIHSFVSTFESEKVTASSFSIFPFFSRSSERRIFRGKQKLCQTMYFVRLYSSSFANEFQKNCHLLSDRKKFQQRFDTSRERDLIFTSLHRVLPFLLGSDTAKYIEIS